MASASTPHNHAHNILNSHFNQTVHLSDWWLVKSEDVLQGRRRLAVAGFASRGGHAKRSFSSAPILKRHNDFNIETTDGICVFLEGFINKARTEENGFPSDVFEHFVFGFPPYWEEYEEYLMDKESPSEDTHLKSPSSLRSEIESGQPHVDNCAEDLELQQKSKKTKSSAVSLPEKPDTVNSDHENNFIISVVACEGIEKKSYPRSPTVEEYHDIPAVTDEFADYSQVDDRSGFRLACELHSQSTNDLSKVGLDKINSSQEILGHTVGRPRTRSMNNSEMKQKNDEKSVGEKIRAKFASSMGSEKVTPVDCEPDQGRNNWNFEAFEFHRCTYKMKPSEFGTPKVKNKDNNKKAKAKATRSRGTSADAADNPKNPKDNATPDTNNVPDNAKSSDMKTRRKLAYETPEREKQDVCASPQCMSFSRSRSGRLVMPPLEFWRNQRAIYGSGRTITGIEEGRINPDPKIKGNPSTPRRKRKRKRKRRQPM